MNHGMHGWLVLDKPLGMSSTFALSKIKHYLHGTFFSSFKKFPLKIGHGGTLDPLATGILPIAVGEATKTVPFVMDAAKEYIFEIQWGEKRTTDDAEGEVVEISCTRPDRDQIERALPNFLGEVSQMPPIFSALKVGGVPAYALARGGKEVFLSSRMVKIYDFELLEMAQDSAKFKVTCGKGTYVRALARDLALSLNTCGYVSSLRRTKVGQFDLACAISLDNLQRLGHKKDEHLFSLNAVLDDIPAVVLENGDTQALKQGQRVSYPLENLLLLGWKKELLVIKNTQNEVIGLATYEKEGKYLHLKRGFNVEI